MIGNFDGGGAVQSRSLSFSLGAKMDLPTDEFYVLAGGKLLSFELVGDGIEDLWKVRADMIMQNGDYSTTDFVSGTATRQAAPTTDQIHFGDCSYTYGSDLTTRLNSLTMRFTRTLEKRGINASGGKYYREFAEVGRGHFIDANLDFSSRTEYENFIDKAGINNTLKVPSIAGGVQMALTNGEWDEGELSIRELDLLTVRLSGEFRDLVVTDVT